MTILLDKNDIEDIFDWKPLAYFVFSDFEDEVQEAISICYENDYPYARAVVRANDRFSCVVEKQLNGGILIRPYRKDLDYYIPKI